MNANWDAPENITRLSTIVCARLRPDPTDTAPKEAPKAAAYSPIPAAARRIAPRCGTVGRSGIGGLAHLRRKSARVVVMASSSQQ